MTACGGSGGSGEQACTLMAAPAGISVDVAAEMAEQVTGGTLEACWDGDCVTRDLKFRPSTADAGSTCAGGVCTGKIEQTGGKHAFADLAGLPQAPVRVTLTLTGADGQVLEEELEVTPEPSYPNGPQCEQGGVQAGLVVSASGDVREGD